MRITLEMTGHHPQGVLRQAIPDHGGKLCKRADIPLEYLLATQLELSPIIENPAQRQQELEDELLEMNSPLRTAEAFGVEDMIDPRETRPLLCRFLEAAQPMLRARVGPRFLSGVRP